MDCAYTLKQKNAILSCGNGGKVMAPCVLGPQVSKEDFGELGGVIIAVSISSQGPAGVSWLPFHQSLRSIALHKRKKVSDKPTLSSVLLLLLLISFYQLFLENRRNTISFGRFDYSNG